MTFRSSSLLLRYCFNSLMLTSLARLVDRREIGIGMALAGGVTLLNA